MSGMIVTTMTHRVPEKKRAHVDGYRSVAVAVGRPKRSRFEMFIQAPVWLLAVLFIVVTAIVVLESLRVV